MSNQTKNAPVKKFRDQYVTVSVWLNENDQGAFYSVSIEASYKDDDGVYKPTKSLQINQLRALRKLLDRADDYILDQRDATREEHAQ